DLKPFSWKSLFVSLLIALVAGIVTCAIWRAGLIDSLQSAFVVKLARREPLETPETWVGLMLIVGVSVSCGFLVSRAGARRSFWILGLGFLATAAASLLVSHYLKVDILFGPLAVGAATSVFAVQLYRLWLIDSLLTDRVNETSHRANIIEPRVAE